MADAPIPNTVSNVGPFVQGGKGSYESDRGIIDSDSKEPPADTDGEDLTGDEPVDDKETEDTGDDDATEGTSDEPEESDGEENEEEEPSGDSEGEDSDLQEGTLYQRLKKANPKLLKDFPELRDVIFSEEKYRELFPTVEMATTSSNKAKVFDHMETQLLGGDSEGLLNALADTDKGAAREFVLNFLPTIQKMSKDMYSEVLYAPIKKALQSAYVNGKRGGNKNLEYAAQHLNEFFFEGEPIERMVEERKKPEKSQAEIRLEQEKSEFYGRQATSFRNDVEQVIIHRLDNDIKSSLVELKLDSYKQKNLIKDIRSEVDRILASDKRYMASSESLSHQARSAGYTSEWKSRIANSYLARAKAALSIAKRKVLVEAQIIKGNSSNGKAAKRLVPSSNSSNTRSDTQIDAKKVDWRRTSDADILNDRPIKYKGIK